LHVEQPDPGRAGEHRRGRLDEQEVPRTQQPAERANDQHERCIGPDHATADARARGARDEPRLYHHRVDRANAEHHEWVPKQAVAEPSPARERRVLRGRERRQVADPTPIQVAGGRMVDGVAMPPGPKGGVDDQAERPAEPGVRALRGEERPMGTIVEDDVGPQQETGGRDGETKREKVRHVERQVHERREREVRGDRGREIDQAPIDSRPGIRGEGRLPVWGGREAVALGRGRSHRGGPF